MFSFLLFSFFYWKSYNLFMWLRLTGGSSYAKFRGATSADPEEVAVASLNFEGLEALNFSLFLSYFNFRSSMSYGVYLRFLLRESCTHIVWDGEKYSRALPFFSFVVIGLYVFLTFLNTRGPVLWVRCPNFQKRLLCHRVDAWPRHPRRGRLQCQGRHAYGHKEYFSYLARPGSRVCSTATAIDAYIVNRHLSLWGFGG